MVELTWWWVLLLLPLPLLVRRRLRPAKSESLAIDVPLISLDSRVRDPRRASTQFYSLAVIWFLWGCLVLAAARPVWYAGPVHRSVTGRDLILAIDISGSMEEADIIGDTGMQTRLTALKSVMTDFIERRRGDRVGLVLFGTRAYPYVPLTHDLDLVVQQLDAVGTGLAGRLTAIGDALGIGIGALEDQGARNRVLILVTDGSNTAGDSEPVVAATIAAQLGVRVHTIGIGHDEETLKRLMQTDNIPPGTALNDSLLRHIAAKTGGRHFRAHDNRSLLQVYATLDQLEPSMANDRRHRPEQHLFGYPLMLGLSVFCLFLLLRGAQGRRSQRA